MRTRKSLSVSRRTFLRSTVLLFPYLLLLIASIVIVILKNGQGATPLAAMTDSLQTGVFGFLYFAFAAYELLTLTQHVSADECLVAIPSARQKLGLAQFAVLLLPLALWSLLIMASHLLFSQSFGNWFWPYIKNVLLSHLLYCFLPGLTGLFLGGVLAGRARPVTYGIILVATLLTSAMPLQLFSGAVVGGVALAPFFDWFTLRVPNVKWATDTVYGVAIETSRWMIPAFWCTLLAAFLLWRYRRKKSLGFIIISAVLILATMGSGIRFAVRQRDSVLIKDDRPNGILRGEDQYYLNHPPMEPVAANFSLTRYDLQLSIKDYLRGQAVLSLDDRKLSSYRFTLSRHFDIEVIENDRKEPLKFVRKGDFITVDPPVETSTITLKYHGSNGKYYANRQAICLPAYCCYYPLPGHKLRRDSDNGAMIPIIAEDPIDFCVKVDSPLQVFSNLPRTAGNEFSGKASGVTLYAGIVTEASVAGITYLYSPLSAQSLTIEPHAIRNEILKLNDLVGLDKVVDTAWSKVVMQPFTIAAADALHEKVVALPDHILVCDIHPANDRIAHELFSQSIPITDKNAVVRRIFLMNLSPDVPGGALEKPAYEDMSILKKYKSHSEINDEDEWGNYIRALEISMQDLFLYQKKALGPKKMLRAVYRYITDSVPDIHPLDFLYNLEEYAHD